MFDMLQDAKRNQAYNEAIRLLINTATVESRKNTIFRCLDIGTGSGLLAGLAVLALPSLKSRTEVYACEGVEEVAEVAARTFDKNELDVHLFRGRSMEMEVGRDLPSRVPFVVSELLGTGLLDEGVIATMRDAKKRLLQPGFVSIPSSAEVYAFLCESEELLRMSRLWETKTGWDLVAPSTATWRNCPGSAAPVSTHVRVPRWGGIGFRPMSRSVQVFDFDFTDLPQESGRQRCIQIPADASGSVNAVICWWRCFLDRDRTIVVSTSPGEPCRDHWRQSVYLMPSAVSVEAGDVVQAIARHDDNMIWFDAVTLKRRQPSRSESRIPTEKNFGERAGLAAATVAAPALREAAGGKSFPGVAVSQQAANTKSKHVWESASRPPPACLCGFHVTCSPFRILMYNDEGRTAAFRLVISEILKSNPIRELDAPNVAEDARLSDRRVVCACVSDGFLLQLLAAKEGATDVLELPSSAAFGAVCREVYRTNGIDGVNIRRLTGGAENFFDLLSPPPGSSDIFAEIGKLDAVLGEPFFVDFSSAWPFESLLLFWCVRTTLEAGGCFSPRTRVLPSRSRLLACAFTSELLWQTRRRVGIVEGLDMSAVNESFGCERTPAKPAGTGTLPGDGEYGYAVSGEDAHIESIMLGEYPHVLLGKSKVVLDMDLTGPLCDLRGGRTELTCSLENAASEGHKSSSVCHGVVFWLDLWLDEEGCHRLCTGPEVPYWPQGILLFEEVWSVPPSGGRFYIEAMLEDGTLKISFS